MPLVAEPCRHLRHAQGPVGEKLLRPLGAPAPRVGGKPLALLGLEDGAELGAAHVQARRRLVHAELRALVERAFHEGDGLGGQPRRRAAALRAPGVLLRGVSARELRDHRVHDGARAQAGPRLVCSRVGELPQRAGHGRERLFGPAPVEGVEEPRELAGPLPLELVEETGQEENRARAIGHAGLKRAVLVVEVALHEGADGPGRRHAAAWARACARGQVPRHDAVVRHARERARVHPRHAGVRLEGLLEQPHILRGRHDMFHDQARVGDRHDPRAAGADLVDDLRLQDGAAAARLEREPELLELRRVELLYM